MNKPLLFALMLFGGICVSDAQSLLNSFNSVPGYRRSTGYWVGYAFTLNTNLTFNAMGYLDVSNAASSAAVDPNDPDGLVASHIVRLYDGTNTPFGPPIAEVTVPIGMGSDFLDGQFRYMYLTSPITLSAGVNYLLAASDASDWVREYGDMTTVTFDASVTNVYSIYSGFNPPDSAAVYAAYLPGAFVTANLVYVNPIPEPTVYPLFAFGLLLLVITIHKMKSGNKTVSLP
ncbi:hypothetical protein QQ056_03875 [Oscillatoria laete-virens NRMC-F 0139]|nr:hypothetical protein [Oscillatoria laete-virens NRMC-F 0139]